MNKSYEPKLFEDNLYASWMEKGYFTAHVNKDKTPFTIVIPPPNITGQLHIGHALDDTIQDAIIRYKRMKGFEALWLPGTDHASIATEVKIVDKLKEEGITKQQIGREGFLKRAYEWKDKYGGRIIEQLKKMGFSCDWSREAFTMDENCSKAVREVFVNLYDKGLIYRGSRIINWCTTCKTAISDAEVEYEAENSHLWHVKYMVDGSDEFIIVATTRPETMLGDTAVAVNPKDKRYKNLLGKMLKLPLTDRLIPVISDDYVDMEFGTGAVKITPAHDPNDFEVGLRHNLAVIRVMNDDGTMSDGLGKYSKMDRFKARKVIVEDLNSLGLLVKIQEHEHNVGHCYRCNSAIEPIVSKQWFVKMEPLSAPAIDAVKNKEINFIPKRFEKVYLHWMENIRDWCISRQLWWGHRIPAFYCDKCGNMEVSKSDLKVCPKCGGALKQDEDVLDTWFSSALWPFSTLGYPEMTEDLKYFYPTNALVTAYDIIFFWVARMIFSGIEHMGEVPFKDVVIHGIVKDDKGRKMSKSLGNGIDPLEIVDNFGADTLRFLLVSGTSMGGDIKFSRDKLDGISNFMNKIWNGARYVLVNCENEKIKEIDEVKLSLADCWILSKLNNTVASITKYMDKYEVGLAASKLYDFVWSDFCDWYVELTKPALYSDDLEKRTGALSVLGYVLKQILKLLHPIIPFITEEIFLEMKNKDAQSIMISDFPTFIKKHEFKKQSKDMESIMGIIKSIRALRVDMNVSQSKRTTLYLQPLMEEKLLKSGAPYIEKLGMGSKLIFAKPTVKSTVIVTPLAEIYIPFNELVDVAAEDERLKKELCNIDSEIKRAEGKLSNQGFVSKAPAELIKTEKEKLNQFKELRKKVVENIENLKNN